MEKDRLEFYKSYFKWRWRLKANNGKIIGASSESYWNHLDCVRNAEMVGENLNRHFNPVKQS